MKYFFARALALTAIGVMQAHAASWQIEVDPRPQDAFEHAEYRLWIPDGLKEVRGILVLQHGCGTPAGADGLRHSEDIQYQALAIKWKLALLAGRQWESDTCEHWVRVERGSGDAFLSALAQLAEKSAHPEISKVRWALWGHSGGGVWVTGMTARFPQRVIATFARSGAVAGPDVIGPGPMTLRPTPEMLQVPMMFCYGIKEEPAGHVMTHFIQRLRALYNLGAERSLWALAIDPVTDHENGDTRYLTMRFFDAVFEFTPELGGKPILQIWRGDPRKLDIEPEGGALRRRNDVALAWLPTADFARAWQEFGRTGQVRDTTAPPAPTRVSRRSIADGVVLSWLALADLESGIREFRVYGDGELLGIVASIRGDDQHEDFQLWNYSDQPKEDPAHNAMRFAWRGRSHKTFTVTTINHFGLESAPSESAESSRWTDSQRAQIESRRVHVLSRSSSVVSTVPLPRRKASTIPPATL